MLLWKEKDLVVRRPLSTKNYMAELAKLTPPLQSCWPGTPAGDTKKMKTHTVMQCNSMGAEMIISIAEC